MFQPFYLFASDDWIKLGTSNSGDTFYYKNVKSFHAHKYAEKMIDYLEPNKDGIMCGYSYIKVNCENFSWKVLKIQFYSRPLCKGKGRYSEKTINKFVPKFKWNFNKPGQMDYILSKHICTNQR